MIPDVLAEHPELRPVFDQYGLHGCGGALGPHESIEFFCRAHGVDAEKLLFELNDVLAKREKLVGEGIIRPDALSADYAPGVADTIYRRFFKTAIAVTLTAGATWGVVLLWQIAVAGSMTKALSLFNVNAHAYAQILGWVGLFIMGFAFQAFPRFKHTTLYSPNLAVATFYLALAGIVLSTLSIPFPGTVLGLPVAVIGGTLTIVSVALFVFIILRTILSSGKPFEASDWYVSAGLFYFLAQACYGLFHVVGTMTAPDEKALVQFVAAYQGGLRDIQIYGLAMMMILGVSQRYIAPILGLGVQNPRLAKALFWPINLALIGAVVSFIVFWKTKSVPWIIVYSASDLALAALVIWLTASWRLFAKSAEWDRSQKFIRTAYAWLWVGLVMLALTPVYLGLSHQLFSHAYGGSVRHIVTVGFISLMIMGVAAKVVPTLSGIEPSKLSNLNLEFALINIGCFLRASAQIATDLTPAAFRVIGFSGVLEVVAIALWGAHLWRIISQGARADEKAPAFTAATLSVPAAITADDKVGIVAETCPETIPVFERYGFGHVAVPYLRRTIARGISIGQACRMHGLDATAFVAELNGALTLSGGRGGSRIKEASGTVPGR
jgi:uncharacterized protein involved in response to NO